MAKVSFSTEGWFPNHEEHLQCFNRLIEKINEEGFNSLVVHPKFQLEHNKGGEYFVYLESDDYFYRADNPLGYIKRCIQNTGIAPSLMFAVNRNGEYVKLNKHIKYGNRSF